MSVICANFKELSDAMRSNPIPLMAGILLLSLSLKAQDDSRYALRLASGSFIPEKNINTNRLNQIDQGRSKISGNSFAILQFDGVLTESEKRQLQLQGIQLLDYIPSFAYTASYTRVPDSSTLRQLKVRAWIEPTAIQKMQPALASGQFPTRAVKVAGTVDVWISFPKTFTSAEVNRELSNILIATGCSPCGFRLIVWENWPFFPVSIIYRPRREKTSP